MKHKVYEAIVRAIKARQLAEPFTAQDFKIKGNKRGQIYLPRK